MNICCSTITWYSPKKNIFSFYYIALFKQIWCSSYFFISISFLFHLALYLWCLFSAIFFFHLVILLLLFSLSRLNRTVCSASSERTFASANLALLIENTQFEPRNNKRTIIKKTLLNLALIVHLCSVCWNSGGEPKKIDWLVGNLFPLVSKSVNHMSRLSIDSYGEMEEKKKTNKWRKSLTMPLWSRFHLIWIRLHSAMGIQSFPWEISCKCSNHNEQQKHKRVDLIEISTSCPIHMHANV